jgi:hypothetical protein
MMKSAVNALYELLCTVGRDSAQPGIDTRSALESVDPQMRSQECLL